MILMAERPKAGAAKRARNQILSMTFTVQRMVVECCHRFTNSFIYWFLSYNYVTDTENFPYGVVFVKHILFNNCFTMEYLAQIVFLWPKYFFFAIQIDIIVTNVSERHMSMISTTREHFL